jgi:hypothetical protein
MWQMSKETAKKLEIWDKEQNDKVKLRQRGKEAYYGAIGGSVEYTFYLDKLNAIAKNTITEEEFHFEYLSLPDLRRFGKGFLERFEEWKKDGHDYSFKYCTTSLGVGVSVIDIATNERKNLTDYSDW